MDPDIVLSPYGVDATYVTVLLNNGSGGFSTPSHVNMLGAAPIAIGDVNGDVIPDLVNSVGVVVLGEGNGKFRPPVSYDVEVSLVTNEVVLADLRQNGLVDIVAAQYDAISVLVNKGNGTYRDGEWVPVPGAGSCAAAADFNGDGKPRYHSPVRPGCPIAGDLNGDGIPDLLEGANSLGGVSAYLGNGDGTFTLAGVSPVGPGIIVLGDFNHDGKLDCAGRSDRGWKSGRGSLAGRWV